MIKVCYNQKVIILNMPKRQLAWPKNNIWRGGNKQKNEN